MIFTIFTIIVEYQEGLLRGLLVTLALCAVVWSIGLLMGTLFGILSSRYPDEIGKPVHVFSFILSGVPVLVFLFWLHYPLQEMLGIVVNPFITASIALSIVNTFAVSEIISTALKEFPKEYLIAGKVCGMKKKKILFNIQIPIIFRQVLPSILNTQVNMLHLTLFASLISVEEIFRVAQRINASIYRPIEIYTALALFFLAICLPMNGLAMFLKKKYTRNLSEK